MNGSIDLKKNVSFDKNDIMNERQQVKAMQV
jgi:hypothetical protein